MPILVIFHAIEAALRTGQLYSTVKNCRLKLIFLRRLNGTVYYSDWVCTAVMSNDVMKDLKIVLILSDSP